MNMPERILSLSYGKDSMACIGACEQLGWKLDRIIHAQVWATDTIPADLPEMVQFKKEADKIILNKYGIKVEHFYAIDSWGRKVTYENSFYKLNISKKNKPNRIGQYRGFPYRKGPWCQRDLKIKAIQQFNTLNNIDNKNVIQIIGIAADEPKRFHDLNGTTKISPLVELGWTEEKCKQWCIENSLLSPIYKEHSRGGCWFCHNQSKDELKKLRNKYPEYWNLLLKWDNDSGVIFDANGHTVHDWDKRFELEEKGLVPTNYSFRWNMLKDLE